MENLTSDYYSRPVKCELNVLRNADGSSMLTQGDTVFMAAVYGPVEVKLQKFQVDKAHVETLYKSKSGLSNVNDRIKENFIKNICESVLLVSIHPRTAINIILQEIQGCGGGLACAVNAACLALINSGLSMRYLVAAVSCMVTKEGCIIVDPGITELEGSQGTMTCVFENLMLDVIGLQTDGFINETQHDEALKKCRHYAENYFIYLKRIISRYAHTI